MNYYPAENNNQIISKIVSLPVILYSRLQFLCPFLYFNIMRYLIFCFDCRQWLYYSDNLRLLI